MLTGRGTATRVWVWMDVSGTCNLACRDCYTKQAHQNTLMSQVQFRHVLDKLSSGPISVAKLHLNWRGEPLTNKRLPEFLQGRLDVLPLAPLEMHTNGILLNARMSKQIVAHSRSEDMFYVSIDGGNPVAHEANRGTDTWEPALRGLETLLDARDAASIDAPKVGIYEIHYGDRTRYDAKLIALSRRCDAWTRVLPIGSHGEESAFEAGEVPSGPCFWAGNSLAITSAGNVHICLLSFRPDGILGNIFDDDIYSILENARRFRSTLITSGRRSVSHCSVCRKTAGELDEPQL